MTVILSLGHVPQAKGNSGDQGSKDRVQVMVLFYHSSSVEEPVLNPFCQLAASWETEGKACEKSSTLLAPWDKGAGAPIAQGGEGCLLARVRLKPSGIRDSMERNSSHALRSHVGRGGCAQGKGPYLTKPLHFCDVSPFTDEQTEAQRG